MCLIAEKEQKSIRLHKSTKKTGLVDRYIKAQDAGFDPIFPIVELKEISKKLGAEWLNRLQECPACSGSKKKKIKATPKLVISFLGANGVVVKYGVCEEHWAELAESDVGWVSGEWKEKFFDDNLQTTEEDL
jgi:hypothetical protein